jgi:hypothetical protein
MALYRTIQKIYGHVTKNVVEFMILKTYDMTGNQFEVVPRAIQKMLFYS